MFSKSFISMLICCFWVVNSYAQELETNLEELLLEQIGEELSEHVDIGEVMERLYSLMKNPLDLNKVTADELASLIFLSPQQITNIISHREQSGDFLNILELQGIVGLDLKTILLLRNFVRVGYKSSLRELSWNAVRKEDEHLLMFRFGRALENQQGYSISDENRSRYLGDQNAYAIRYRWNYQQKIRIGFNAEKDAGEPFFQLKQKYGFDFYSGYIEINDLNKFLRKVVIGDYAIQSGQGLVMWNGLSFGKGAWIGAIAKQGIGLRSYSSMNENNFQRGLAAQFVFDRFSVTPYIAYNKLSGNLEDTDGTNFIKSINISGLHRTPTEQRYRDVIKQLVIGSDFSYQYKRLKVGVTGLYTSYNAVMLRSAEIRNQYDFEGKDLFQLALNYKYNFRNVYLFGETAHSIGSGFATINGLIASLHPKVSAFVSYRNFQRDYHSFFAQSVSEGSNMANEKGLYTGVIYQVTRKFEWVNYVDMFKFPWLRFRVDGPSEGVDFLSQATYSWYKRGKFMLRYRYRLKQENLSLANANENILADVLRNQFRLEYQYKLNDTWSIKSRAELSLFEKKMSNRSEGYMLFQDIFWKGLRNKLNLNLRIGYFDTKDYDSRIYAYESDVLYASSFPMYYDRGIRSYLNVRCRIFKSTDVWLRYALTHYLNRETVGSGLDMIDGNKKSDLKLQVRWQW